MIRRLAEPAVATCAAVFWATTCCLPVRAGEPGEVEVLEPDGDFARYVLTLDEGFAPTDGSGAGPLIVHLPLRSGRLAPEGWCVEPGANIIGVVDARALRAEGGRIAGTLSVFPWERGVSRVYELDGTVASGSFVLRQTVPDAVKPVVARGRFTGKALTGAELARNNDLETGKQFPMWRGPNGSGNSDSGRALVLSPSNARLAWLSEDLIPNAAWNIGTKGLSGGCDNVCVESGRVYLVYYVPSGDVVAKNVDLDKPLPEYTREKWRLHWLVEADDVIHCFDARTGATLWKTVFKRTGLNTNAREPGLKGTPHRTVCVADGKAFAVGSAGHLFCVDAASGKEVWRSELPRAKRIADRVRRESVAERYVCGVSILDGHPVYAEGMLVCADTGGTDNWREQVAFVQGYDARTGALVWTFGLRDGFCAQTSVNRWMHDGRAYVIATGQAGAACLDPKTGKALWRRKEAVDIQATTVALGDGYMVTSGRGDDDKPRTVVWEEGSFPTAHKKTPMRCYRLTPAEAVLLWERPCLDYVGKCVPLIRGGHMYAKAGGHVSKDWTVKPASSSRRCSIVCVELASGRIASVANEVSTCEWESYVGGDGMANHGWGLGQWRYGMFRADPEELRLLDPLELPRKPHYGGWCATPAYADGRLFIRTWDRLACYDLRMDERVIRAGEALGRNDSASAVGLFSDACRDSEASVRREGVAGLSRLSAQAESAFDLLVELARDDIASSVRAAAVQALASVMRARPERLIGLLGKGGHPRARAAAAVALGAFEASDPRIVEAEALALGDGEPAVRLAAIEALAGWKRGAASASAALAGAIRERGPVEADMALEALKNIGEAGGAAAPILVEVLAGGSDERSGRAAAALACMGRPAAAEVAKRIRDGDPRVAVRCIELLGGLKSAAAAAVPALTDLLAAREWPRASAAASALAAIDETQEPLVVSALIERLPGSDADVFAECSMALAGLAAGAKREATRQTVVDALSKGLEKRMGAAGLSAGDRERSGKICLLRALGRIGPGAKSAMPVLKRALGHTDLADETVAAWQKILPDLPIPKPEMATELDL